MRNTNEIAFHFSFSIFYFRVARCEIDTYAIASFYQSFFYSDKFTSSAVICSNFYRFVSFQFSANRKISWLYSEKMKSFIFVIEHVACCSKGAAITFAKRMLYFISKNDKFLSPRGFRSTETSFSIELETSLATRKNMPFLSENFGIKWNFPSHCEHYSSSHQLVRFN